MTEALWTYKIELRRLSVPHISAGSELSAPLTHSITLSRSDTSPPLLTFIMKYSQAALIACVGGATLASAFPLGQSTSVDIESRDFDDQLVSSRAFDDELFERGGLNVPERADHLSRPATIHRSRDFDDQLLSSRGFFDNTWNRLWGDGKAKKSKPAAEATPAAAPPKPQAPASADAGELEAREFDEEMYIREFEELFTRSKPTPAPDADDTNRTPRPVRPSQDHQSNRPSRGILLNGNPSGGPRRATGGKRVQFADSTIGGRDFDEEMYARELLVPRKETFGGYLEKPKKSSDTRPRPRPQNPPQNPPNQPLRSILNGGSRNNGSGGSGSGGTRSGGGGSGGERRVHFATRELEQEFVARSSKGEEDSGRPFGGISRAKPLQDYEQGSRRPFGGISRAKPLQDYEQGSRRPFGGISRAKPLPLPKGSDQGSRRPFKRDLGLDDDLYTRDFELDQLD
ncbi:hypothetical protein DXG03_006862 [Asterophora parasitica]|uniref:Uncharacterized protein n=1 Tax=Asterophora parasitica TaxID=117018 RepID=A0A9P7GD61_9AGAR|nr:hypothetical protein DXG03_006862 [Asterophora parasitica]